MQAGEIVGQRHQAEELRGHIFQPAEPEPSVVALFFQRAEDRFQQSLSLLIKICSPPSRRDAALYK
jgi:hypothetical protein